MANTNDDADRPPRLARIEAALHARVRPELQELGGDVELVGIDESSIVQVRLLGACAVCASSTYTWTMLIESSLKREFPEVRAVEAIL